MLWEPFRKISHLEEHPLLLSIFLHIFTEAEYAKLLSFPLRAARITFRASWGKTPRLGNSIAVPKQADICICYLDIIIKMLHTTNNMSLFLHDLLFRFVFSAHFPAVFQKFSKGALPPRTPLGGLERPPSPLLTKISRAVHAQILTSLRIYPRSQSVLLKINHGSAHVFLSKRGACTIKFLSHCHILSYHIVFGAPRNQNIHFKR